MLKIIVDIIIILLLFNSCTQKELTIEEKDENLLSLLIKKYNSTVSNCFRIDSDITYITKNYRFYRLGLTYPIEPYFHYAEGIVIITPDNKVIFTKPVIEFDKGYIDYSKHPIFDIVKYFKNDIKNENDLYKVCILILKVITWFYISSNLNDYPNGNPNAIYVKKNKLVSKNLTDKYFEIIFDAYLASEQIIMEARFSGRLYKKNGNIDINLLKIYSERLADYSKKK